MTDWIGGFAKLAKAYPKAEPAVQFRERLKSWPKKMPMSGNRFSARKSPRSDRRLSV